MIYFFLATPYMYNTIHIFRIYAHICLVWLWFQTCNLQMCCSDHFDEHFNCHCLKRMAHDSTGNKIRAASFCLNQCWCGSMSPHGVTRAQWKTSSIWRHLYSGNFNTCMYLKHKCLYNVNKAREPSWYQFYHHWRYKHGHQGWNVRHGLCHIYMIYVYIWVVYSFCLFCCLLIIVTTQFVALYKPCKPKPKPSTDDPPDNHPLAEIQRPILRPEPKQQICHQHANTDHFGK